LSIYVIRCTGPAGVACDSSNGYVYVANHGSGTVSVISTSPQIIKKYSVTFTESGLPSGTLWSVTLNETTETSTTDTITFSVPNGKYSYTIGSISGYIESPSSGTKTVNGADVNQGITFTLNGTKVFVVTFTKNGLPSGTIWYVNLSNGQSFSSTTTIITFYEPNGTYSYTISIKDKNYSAAISSGTFTVNGTNVNQTITFKAVTTSTNVITSTNYLLYIVIVIVVIIAVLAVVMTMKRGKNKGGPKQWQEPPKQQPPQQ